MEWFICLITFFNVEGSVIYDDHTNSSKTHIKPLHSNYAVIRGTLKPVTKWVLGALYDEYRVDFKRGYELERLYGGNQKVTIEPKVNVEVMDVHWSDCLKVSGIGTKRASEMLGYKLGEDYGR